MAVTMTQPKKKRKPGAGRPKGEKPPRAVIVTFKGYPEFDEWMDRLAASMRLPKSLLIEHALIEYARSHEFDEPPPER
jgi:hypothetical protein